MSEPRRRRILVRGLDPHQVLARVASYDELYEKGPQTYAIAVSEPVGGWIQVEVPVDMPLSQFHNFAKWFEGDHVEKGAEDLIALSHGEGNAEYWLVPAGPDADWVLSGANGEGQPFQWDCVDRKAVDKAKWQRAPMGPRLALMTRNVHAALHSPEAKPAKHGEVALHLEPPDGKILEMPKPASIEEAFARTSDPNANKGGFQQVLEWVGSLFKR